MQPVISDPHSSFNLRPILKTCLFICKRIADELKITSHIWGKFKRVTQDSLKLCSSFYYNEKHGIEIARSWNCCIYLNLQFVQFGKSTTAQVMLKTFSELDDQGKWHEAVRLDYRGLLSNNYLRFITEYYLIPV
jgi:hypothetical protein